MNELREAKELHQDIEYIKLNHPLLFDRLCEEYDPHAETMPVRDKRVINLFSWNTTREGREFWDHVDDRQFARAKQMCPEYFEGSNVKSEYVCQDEQQNPTVSFNYDTEIVIKMLQSLDPIEQVKELSEIAKALREGWIDERTKQAVKKNEAYDNYNLLDKAISNS